jgi:hypothetical protein
VAQIHWFVALVSWLVIVYAVPVALVARREGKPGFRQGIQGNWLLWSVGTASVSSSARGSRPPSGPPLVRS